MAQDRNIPVQPEDLPLEGVADVTMVLANAEPEHVIVVPSSSSSGVGGVQPEDLPIEGDATAMMPGIDMHREDVDADDVEAPNTTISTTETQQQQRRQQRNWWIPFFFVLCIGALLILIIGLAIGLTQNVPPSSTQQEVHNYILANQFSTAESLLNPNTPQGKAAIFMTQYALPSSSSNSSDAALTWLDTYVMSVFYYSTNGQDWVREIGFQNVNEHVCDWHIYLRTGSGVLIPYGASCGDSGRVNSLAICKYKASFTGTHTQLLSVWCERCFLSQPIHIDSDISIPSTHS